MDEKQVSFIDAGYWNGMQVGVRILIKASHALPDGVESEISRKANEIKELIYQGMRSICPRTIEAADRQKNELLSLFNGHLIKAEAIKNGYDSDPMFPWFKVYTTVGPITIGWRKRVISIDWGLSDISTTADHLFPHENVTKHDRLIHAWDLGKAKDYVDLLLEFANVRQ